MSDSVELVWSRSAVYIHPTKNNKDNIAGYLSLVRPPDGEILISWVPESLIKLSKQDYESYVQVDLSLDGEVTQKNQVFVSKPPSMSVGSLARSSHAFSIKLSDLYSMQMREPSLGWWYGSILLFTKQAETLPVLFFHDDESEVEKRRTKTMQKKRDDWGGEFFMEKLENYVDIRPSTLEKGVYLINPSAQDTLAFAPPVTTSNEVSGPNSAKVATWGDLKWNIFEKLAQVTRYSRKASQSMFDRTPAPLRSMLNIPEVEQLGQDFDSARVFLAEWALGIVQDQEDFQRKNININLNTYDSHFDDFSIVAQSIERRNPVTLEEWESFFDENDGRLTVTAEEVKERIFHGGLEPQVRPKAWLFLLNVYPWDTSAVERASIIAEKRNEYYRLKRKWWENIDMQENDSFWKDQKNRIEKDVLRTDRNIPLFEQSETPHPDPDSRLAQSGANPHLEQMRDMLITYNEYNENLGYVQGMSDLLSPLYVVLQDDALAFAAFCGFMERMERNFMRSQEGMRDQLSTLGHLTNFMLPKLYSHLAKADSIHFFFFFRMILVWFKREFEWDDVLRLWEVLWTNYYSSQFHLFIALAILDLNKAYIIERLHYFDEILKFINELSMTLDLDTVLTRAEELFTKFKLALDLVNWQNNQSEDTKSQTEVTEDLRMLLSREIVDQREQARPPGATGG